jgi:hypothetical protein
MTVEVPIWRRWLGHAAGMLLPALAITAMAVPTAAAQDGNPWSDVQKIGTLGDSGIAASGRNVYVAYGSDPVYVRRSTDEGATFSEAILLSQDGVMHETDSLAAEGSDVFAITFKRTGWRRDWCCARDVGDLVLHRSTDSGASWLPAFPLTTSGDAFRVSIAVALPYVHVVWSDFRGDRWAIYYRRSTDSGATWEPEQRLVAPGLEETNRPQIAALGESVHFVWMDNRDGNGPCYTLPHCTETYYMRSFDAGASWSAARRLTFNRSQKPLLSGRPDVAAFATGAVFVAYDQDLEFGQSSAQHGLYSPDRGQTWEAPFRLGHTPKAQTHASVAALGRTGGVAWFDRRYGSNAEVFVRVTEDSGRTWHDEERVSFTPGESSTPHVAFTPGFLHVVWLETQNGGLLYRRRAIHATNGVVSQRVGR